MKKKKILIAGLFACIMLMVPLTSVTSAIDKPTEQEPLTDEIEAKDFLLETIVEIANNPDVKELLEQVDSELFEITVQICELDSIQNYTILITHQQLEELNNLIDNVENQLDNANSIEECKSIYESAVLSLNNIGVLPDELSVEEYQQLVTDINGNQRLLDLINRLNKQVSGNDYAENFLCLIAGQTNYTFIIGPSAIASIILGFGAFLGIILMTASLEGLDLFFHYTKIGKFLYERNPNLIESIMSTIYGAFLITAFSSVILSFMPHLQPFKMISFIGLGVQTGNPDWHNVRHYPANGWLFTIGINGIQYSEGPFYGQLSEFLILPLELVYYIGVLGFTGIKIGTILTDTFYIGTALKVAIGPDC